MSVRLGFALQGLLLLLVLAGVDAVSVRSRSGEEPDPAPAPVTHWDINEPIWPDAEEIPPIVLVEEECGAAAHETLRSEGAVIEVSAVDAALIWLERHQRPDGSWSRSGEATEPGDIGTTALALLAFLSAGETHKTGGHKDCVKRGLLRLRKIQDEYGRFGSRDAPDGMTHHAMATYAMAEAYALTGSPLFKRETQRGVDFLRKVRVPEGGFAAKVGSSEPEFGITIWAVLAMRAARESGGIRVRVSFDAETRAWLEAQVAKNGSVAGPAWKTPAAVVARLALNTCSREYVELGSPGFEHCVKRAPELIAAPSGMDGRWWFFGSLAVRYRGEEYRSWCEAVLPVVLERQRRDGEVWGSWDPVPTIEEGGSRVRTTALVVEGIQIVTYIGHRCRFPPR